MTGGPDAEDTDLRAAHAHFLENREALARRGRCGCFHSLSVFGPSDVEDWIGEKAARCPGCGIDAVLSAHAAPIDPDFLRRMRARYFERVVRW